MYAGASIVVYVKHHKLVTQVKSCSVAAGLLVNMPPRLYVGVSTVYRVTHYKLVMRVIFALLHEPCSENINHDSCDKVA